MKEPLLLDNDDVKWFASCGQEFGINSNMEPIDCWATLLIFLQAEHRVMQLSVLHRAAAVWDRGSTLYIVYCIVDWLYNIQRV